MEMRRNVDSVLADHRAATKKVAEETVYLQAAETAIAECVEAKDILQTAGQGVQQTLHDRIADVVTECLVAVFGETFQFRISFEKKRGKTEARLVFIKDGDEYEAKAGNFMAGSVPGGVCDVASFALRMACLMLGRPQPRRILIADEPFRFVDRENRLKVRHMLERLAEDLDIQLILCTHDPELQTGAIVRLGG